MEQVEIKPACEIIYCTTCDDPFTPLRGFNGIIQSRVCGDCRYKDALDKRRALKSSPLKSPEIANKAVVREFRTSETPTVRNSRTVEKSDGSKKKGGKRISEKGLKAKLDRIFSVFIRQRDSKDGAFKCISCEIIKSYKLADCGHYINRANMTTRYDEINCNAQCSYCNRFREGNNQGYRKGLIKKYGEQAIDRLEMKKHNTSKISSVELEIMIRLYTAKNKAFGKPDQDNLHEGNNF